MWRLSDLAEESPMAVAQELSRLTARGELVRVGRGLYYRGRPTALGASLPDPGLLLRVAAGRHPVFPAGLAAAAHLGFTTQTPSRPEVSTVATSLRRSLAGGRTVVHTRRPSAWRGLRETDGALLEFLRDGGALSELTADATIARTLELLRESRRYRRLLSVSDSEPPRVRALLGALGAELGVAPSRLRRLRQSLNPLSRFDFGVFRGLPTASEWLAKAA